MPRRKLLLAGAVLMLAAGVSVALVALIGGGASERAVLLPDLDQRAPYSVIATSVGGRELLVFGSRVENVGDGPLLIDGRRPDVDTPEMQADQVLSDGFEEVDREPAVGTLRYVQSSDHAHWHLQDFERYELRSEDGSTLVATDQKTGFCLGDRYRIDRAVQGGPLPAVWVGQCARNRPESLTVREGISVGFGDDYAALLEGQSIDVTDVPPGSYQLIHTVNPDGLLDESDQSNDSASTLIDLARVPGGGSAMTATVLATCEDRSPCPEPSKK